MKSCSGALAAHVAQGQTTLTTLLLVTRLPDGAVYGFTEHDQDVIVGGQTYKASSSYGRSNVNAKANAEATGYEITGAFDSVITRDDVIAGLWDNATIQLLLVNWANTSMGTMILATGSFGTFDVQEYGFKVELHGLSYLLTFMGGEICGPTCRVDFGSAKCAPSGSLASGTTINSLLQTGVTVVTTDGSRVMTVTGLTNTGQPFDGGLATFQTGNNAPGGAGLSGEILHVDFTTTPNPTITLRPTVLLNVIAPGDTLAVFPACDKAFSTCVFWQNAENFQGEPHAPDPDAVIAYPDYVAPHG